MLILDTNALYYACGLSASPTSVDVNKLLQEIDTAGKVAISSITFVEFLTKYRHKAKIVRHVCTFMSQHHIDIINNFYFPLAPNTIHKYRKIRQNAFDEEYKQLFERKIDIESRFCTLIFLLVLISETIFECNIDPANLSTPVFTFLSNIFKSLYVPTFGSVFNTIYRDAYKTDNAENDIRQAFYRLLNTFIPLTMPICQQVIDVDRKANVGDIVDLEEIIRSYNSEEWTNKMCSYQQKIKKLSTPAQFVFKCGIKYGKKINDKHLHFLLTGLENSICKIVNCRSLNEYIFLIVRNCISNGGSFQKNDINDALILSDLTSDDVVISFDGGMHSHMKKYSSQRPEYQNSITLIQQLRE